MILKEIIIIWGGPLKFYRWALGIVGIMDKTAGLKGIHQNIFSRSTIYAIDNGFFLVDHTKFSTINV